MRKKYNRIRYLKLNYAFLVLNRFLIKFNILLMLHDTVFMFYRPFQLQDHLHACSQVNNNEKLTSKTILIQVLWKCSFFPFLPFLSMTADYLGMDYSIPVVYPREGGCCCSVVESPLFLGWSMHSSWANSWNPPLPWVGTPLLF